MNNHHNAFDDRAADRPYQDVEFHAGEPVYRGGDGDAPFRGSDPEYRGGGTVEFRGGAAMAINHNGVDVPVVFDQKGSAHVGRFDSNNPRYICCGKKIERMAVYVCYAEIAISALLLIVVLPVANSVRTVSLPAIAIFLVIYVVIKLIMVGTALYGIRTQKYQFLIAYLVFKGLEVGAAGVFIFIVFLLLIGHTTFSSIVGEVAAQSGPPIPESFPVEEDEIIPLEYEYADVIIKGDQHVSVTPPPPMDKTFFTGVFTAAFLGLAIILGFGVFFFIVMIKCYRLSRDRTYMDYQLKHQNVLIRKAESLPSTLQRAGRRSANKEDERADAFGNHVLAASMGNIPDGNHVSPTNVRTATTETDPEYLSGGDDGEDAQPLTPGRITKAGRFAHTLRLAATQTSHPPPPYSIKDPSPGTANARGGSRYQPLMSSDSHSPAVLEPGDEDEVLIKKVS